MNKLEKKCRICNSTSLNKLLSLENMPLTDNFIDQNKPFKKEFIEDIDIYLCKDCFFVQNPHNFNYQVYYDTYEYSSGHSEFTKIFMSNYAISAHDYFIEVNNRKPTSVIEIGSGDGSQLKFFKELGLNNIIGIEPSKILSDYANLNGIKTVNKLFNKENFDNSLNESFDIFISSYTFDHVSNPLEFLKLSHKVLNENGIFAVEIHNLDDIYKRNEFCLFEHEHTIYLNQYDIHRLLSLNNFDVISINPINQKKVRANSLIAIARKKNNQNKNLKIDKKEKLIDLQKNIDQFIVKIDSWLERKVAEKYKIIAFGAGGRGVMTIAALKNYHYFKGILDSNYSSNKYLAPKTHLPIFGPETWKNFSDHLCLVFSYGYFNEIKKQLINCGFKSKNIISLEFFFN